MIEIDLTETEEKNARLIAIQNKTTVENLVRSTISAILSGEAAYILLFPAPPPDVVHEVKEAVNRLINKEKSYIYIPEERRTL